MKLLWGFGVIQWVAISLAVAQYKVEGYVKDGITGAGLSGATVTLHELSRHVVTDTLGRFELDGLRRASYHVHISYMGYASDTKMLRVAAGQHVDYVLFPTAIELNEIVVESNHYKTGAKEHTLAIEILDAGFLRNNRKNTFVNSLEDLPGINAINTGVGIAKPVIRGLSFNRIIVNDNGIKQEGQQWGADHGLEIDMFEPGRVEVIKGPVSLLYGSEGLGGVINIFPRALPSDSTLQGSFQSVYKTNNHLAAFSAMAEKAAGNKVFRVRVSSQDFGDYRVTTDRFRYNSYELPIYRNRLKNTAGNERNVLVMTGVKKNWGYSTVTLSNFHQKAGMFAGAIGIPRAYQLTPDGSTRNIELPYQQINHFKAVSNTSLLLGKNWAELDIGYQHNNRNERSNPHAHGKNPGGTLAHGLQLQTLSLNARYFQHPGTQHSRISGIQVEMQKNRQNGFEYLLPDFQRLAAGVFAYEEVSWANRWTGSAGIRADYGLLRIAESQEALYGSETEIARYFVRNPEIQRNFFNVSGGMGLSYYPSQAFNAKLNFGSSFRMPAPSELAMNGVHHGTFRHELGNAGLSSERGYQLDLNFSVQKKYLSVVVSPFAAYYDQYIYLAPTSRFSSSLDPDAFPEGGQIFQYSQHNAVYAGGEIAVDYHPVQALHIKSAFECVFNQNLDTGLPLPFTPPPAVFGEISYEMPFGNSFFRKPRAGVNLKVVAAQNRTDRNERATGGYSLLGASLGTTVGGPKWEADLFITAHNLGNTAYMNHLSRYRLLNLPEQGRNFSINLIVPFATM